MCIVHTVTSCIMVCDFSCVCFLISTVMFTYTCVYIYLLFYLFDISILLDLNVLQKKKKNGNFFWEEIHFAAIKFCDLILKFFFGRNTFCSQFAKSIRKIHQLKGARYI